MLKYLMLWYRAKTYCPVIDSLYSEPEMWIRGRDYGYFSGTYRSPSYDSIVHKTLHIEIKNVGYISSAYPRDVVRNGHTLPVHKKRLERALKARKDATALKVLEAARAELNRVTQDAQTLRLARITELRKSLAVAEAADFAYRLEHE